MKIRLAILEADEGYLKRIVTAFNAKFPDKLEIYSFTDKNTALQSLAPSKIDVFVASESFEIDPTRIPKRCGFAYFVDSADVELLNNQPTICRFQKADLIYRQILSIYSEHAGTFTELKLNDEGCQVIAFASPGGGGGTSIMAAACALHFAAQGSKTFYLNLEPFGSADDFFSGPGQFDMSDVIYALKTRRANLAMKLESCSKQDARGVSFLSSPKLALDMMELTNEEVLRLIHEIRVSGEYDYLIVDTSFDLRKDTLKVLHQANAVVLVGSGNTTSNTKLRRAISALSVMEQNADDPLMNRMVLAYNRFSSKVGTIENDLGIRVVGAAPRSEHATTEQLLEQLSKNGLFDEILK